MFEKLFEPGKIGKLALKNRIIMAPMVTCYAVDGEVTERQIKYYQARAQGGAGLITTEATFFVPRPGATSLWDDKYIPGLRKLANTVHEAGAKIAIEIQVGRGRQDPVDPATASEFYDPRTGLKARAMTVSDIEGLVAAAGEGVRRAKEAGFDAVTVHGGPGRLLSDFLSPVVNKRNDKYGGSTEGRTRFAIELIEILKSKAGKDFPVIFRLTADHRLGDGGLVLTEAKLICQILERAGSDAIDVTSGAFETFEWIAGPKDFPKGYNVPLAEEIKKVVSIPISVAGRITDPFIAQEILEESKADFVTMGRALLADPELPQKTMTGKTMEIRKCIHCYECMRAFGEQPPRPMTCSVNAMAGREDEIELRSAGKPRKILVIGAGPAGMEAARVAARRGHKVTMWEKDHRIGGQLNLAAMAPHGDEFGDLAKYFGVQIKKLGIKLNVRKKASVDAIIKFKPDAIVLATGAVPIIPDIEGIKNRNVLTFEEAFIDIARVKQNVIILGGGLVACELAKFLRQKGKKVTIVEMLADIARDIFGGIKSYYLQTIYNAGITIYTNTNAKKITDKGLEIINEKGEKSFLAAETVVIAVGSQPDKELFNALKEKGLEVYQIGDCVDVRRIVDSTREGFLLGCRL